jgi:pyruvate,orthophosphate dikinase
MRHAGGEESARKERVMGGKYVYFFGMGEDVSGEGMRNTLGGKGAGLAEMTRLGMPVPAGFTVSTDVCTFYFKNNGAYPDGFWDEFWAGVERVEQAMDRRLGDPGEPLLFSVRSGARVSMPGMMDTVLNLGLNDETVEGLARMSEERSAYDCYRRLIQMYGDVVMGLKPETKDERDPFHEVLDAYKAEIGADLDTELTADHLKELIGRYKDVVRRKSGTGFPQDPREQLSRAVGAVFGSWDNERARTYRAINRIPDDWGTAANVQAMVFGNLGWDSATGVAFSRNPATGEKGLYGEYLANAQGEDVVAGIRTPHRIADLGAEMHETYAELSGIVDKLETHYRDMQDVEFTIERGKLWMLQTRAGKRTGLAAVRIAAEMADEGLIRWEEALMRVEPDQLNQLLKPTFDESEKRDALATDRLLAKGLNAGPGAATGQIVFSAEDAEAWSNSGKKVILVRIETSPEDIRGMHAAEGILTSRGGMTSHAALVGRQMGKVCVVGCKDLEIDYARKELKVAGRVLREGDSISLDGSTGEVIAGSLRTRPSPLEAGDAGEGDSAAQATLSLFSTFMEEADRRRRLRVRANADQPDQARTAVRLGGEGIGLCRTEHMFFAEDRIGWVRRMILADTEESRLEALDELLPMQREDFKGIFREMAGRPVTIRTLDPPLHEFLPQEDASIRDVADEMGVSPDEIKAKVVSLHESNPMLGHRGCRLGLTYPEITRMQARAIMEAACDVKKEGTEVRPEIMIPLVGARKELELQAREVRAVAEEVMREKAVEVDYLVGTMIELPRAALTGDEIAEVAEFFSYGTNDLTQTAFGLSRDDAGKFLPQYVQTGILPHDPFQTIDFDGVGLLMQIGVEKGRSTRPDLKVGICGEHGGDPRSVEFCHRIGLDYVSCSPFRIPIARLAAAQAALREAE